MATQQIILYVAIGALAAIIYSLRILFNMESRMVNMEKNIQKLVKKVLKTENKIARSLKKKR